MRTSVLALLLVGCVDEPLPPPPVATTSYVTSFDIPGTAPKRLDVVIAIDATEAMAPYLDRVAELPTIFDQELEGYGYHGRRNVAVITATGAPRGRIVEDLQPDGAVVANYSGTFTEAFGELLAAAAAETGPVQPLEALRGVLASPDFRRIDTDLVVATITASDDASPGAISDYFRDIVDAASRGRNVYLTTVRPRAAPRLEELARRLPSTTVWIDDAAWWNTFSWPRLPDYHVVSPCIATPVDRDPETPGSQYECAISLVDDDTGTEALLPACAVTDTPPCWHIEQDMMNCSPSAELSIVTVRGYTAYRPHVRGQCIAR